MICKCGHEKSFHLGHSIVHKTMCGSNDCPCLMFTPQETPEKLEGSTWTPDDIKRQTVEALNQPGVLYSLLLREELKLSPQDITALALRFPDTIERQQKYKRDRFWQVLCALIASGDASCRQLIQNAIPNAINITNAALKTDEEL